MKTFLLSLHLAIVALIVAASPTETFAQSDMSLEPGIVISMASVDEHLGDIEHLMDASGFGQMSGLIRMGAAEYIRGIDADKPIGALLFFEGENPEPKVLAFMPVTDVEDVLDTLAPFVDIDEDGDDIVLTTNEGDEFTVRVDNGYAFISQDKAMFEALPENPSELLADLPAEFNIAARIFGQRIPEELRQQAIDLIRSGAESEMGAEGDSPEAEMQRAQLEYTMERVESFINETEEVVAGLAIDEDGKRIYFDVKVVGLPDSALAKQSNVLADAPESKFGGFVREGAAASLYVCGKMQESDIEQLESMLDNVREKANEEIDGAVGNDFTAEQGEKMKSIANDLLVVLGSSLKKGYMDMGASLMLEDDKFEVVAGLSIAEGAKLEASVKELAKLAEESGELNGEVKFDFDFASENGIRFHKITVQIPDNEEEAQKMFGSEIAVVLGVADEALYVAVSEDAKALILSGIGGTAADTDGAIALLDIHFLPFMRFAFKFQEMDDMNDLLESFPVDTKDRMRMSLRTVENGQHYRFEMEDAVLEIFGQMGQAMGGGAFPPPQDF